MTCFAWVGNVLKCVSSSIFRVSFIKAVTIRALKKVVRQM
jgi:hypothetical protein